MQEMLLITLGAALGANTRYWLSNWFAARFGPAFPWGTLVINLSGSLLIGLTLTLLSQRLVADPAYRLVLVTGFLGAYTTFSTFSYDTVALLQRGDPWPALANIAAHTGLGLLATFAGVLIGRWLA